MGGYITLKSDIRYLAIQGEKLLANPAASEEFKTKLTNIMAEMEIPPDQIYNCDETGLFWMLIPNKTFVCRNEKSAEGRIKPKKYIYYDM